VIKDAMLKIFESAQVDEIESCYGLYPLVGWLVGQSGGWLVGWSIGWLVNL